MILIVEDEKEIAKFVDLELQAENYETVVTYDGVTGLSKFRELNPDLVVLDLMLPVLDGLEVARRIRKTSNTPIIILTAKDSVDDKVTGLDSGADDYLVKPFSMPQLEARVRAVLRRRGGGAEHNRIDVGELVIDVPARTATLKGEPLDLSPKEFDMLRALVDRAGEVMTKRELLAEVWREPYGGSEHTVDVHISWLRKKLGESAQEPRYIQTVHGVGVKLVNPGQ